MGYYFMRKISRAKWPSDYEGKSASDVEADAITNCLKTKKNELSLWRVDNTSDSINNVLPIITGFEKPASLDLVYIKESLLEESGLEYSKSVEDGRTPVQGLEDTHYNVKIDTYVELGKFAEVILKSLDSHERIVQNDVKKKLKELIDNEIINKDEIGNTMLEKLGYELPSDN